MELVFIRILALVDQVIGHELDLDDLLALPTSSQHGALLPVVNIDWLRIECLVVSPTEVANVFIFFLTIGISDFRLVLLLLSWLLSWSDGVLRGLFVPLRIIIRIRHWLLFLTCACTGSLLGVRRSLLFLLTTSASHAGSHIFNCRLDLLALGRTQLTQTIPNCISNRSVKLNNDFLRLYTDVLHLMLNTRYREIQSKIVTLSVHLHALIYRFLKDSREGCILACYLLVRI